MRKDWDEYLKTPFISCLKMMQGKMIYIKQQNKTSFIQSQVPSGVDSTLIHGPFNKTQGPNIKVSMADGQVIPYHSRFIIIENCSRNTFFESSSFSPASVL